MNFLSRLFRRHRRSALEEFGASLTTNAIAAAMRTNDRRDDRLARGLYVGKILPREDRAMADFFCSIVLAIIDGKVPDTGASRSLALVYT